MPCGPYRSRWVLKDPCDSQAYERLLDESEQLWKINRLEKDVPGTGRSCLLIQFIAAIRGDDHHHHEWLQLLEVRAKSQAIHAWHPHIQQAQAVRLLSRLIQGRLGALPLFRLRSPSRRKDQSYSAACIGVIIYDKDRGHRCLRGAAYCPLHPWHTRPGVSKQAGTRCTNIRRIQTEFHHDPHHMFFIDVLDLTAPRLGNAYPPHSKPYRFFGCL